MPSLFRTWTYKHATDAKALVIRTTVGDAGFTANEAYAEKGDHWQEGTQWPASLALAPQIRTRMLQSIEPQFRPVDVIGEALDNVANGLLEQEPDVSFAPLVPAADPESAEGKAQAKAIADMVGAVSAWWDRRQFWEEARKAVRRSRWATRGALRLWITRASLVTTKVEGAEVVGLPRNLDFAAALEAIQVMAPSPNDGLVFTDPDTQQRVAIFFYQTGEESAPRKWAELWFVDGDETVLRVVPELGEPKDTVEFPIALGRRLPISQMVADLLITETVRRQQKSLNFFETLLVRVVESAGFPERYTTNAKPSGIWLETPPAGEPPAEVQEVGEKTYYLHPAPRQLGPTITTDLRGVTITDETGKSSLATPGVVFKDPTDPEYLTKASDHGRKTMLRECKQGHLATDSTAESSGNAYIQARAIFGKDLKATKAPLEGMVREAIEALIALGEHMSGVAPAASFLTKYRCVVNLHVDTGPASPLELQENRAQNAAGLLSQESAMARGGVEDVAAELEALRRDPVALASLRKAQGEALNALVTAGGTFDGSAQLLGLSVEEIATLQGTDLTNGDVRP